jgi:hypothetical protein
MDVVEVRAPLIFLVDQFSHLFLWLWSEHAQEVETRDKKDGEELIAIVK